MYLSEDDLQGVRNKVEQHNHLKTAEPPIKKKKYWKFTSNFQKNYIITRDPLDVMARFPDINVWNLFCHLII